jgi:hypothetical protein
MQDAVFSSIAPGALNRTLISMPTRFRQNKKGGIGFRRGSLSINSAACLLQFHSVVKFKWKGEMK